MSGRESLRFGHEDRKRIYQYVERRGSATLGELERELGIDPGGLRHHVAILKRDGRIEADESGSFRVSLDGGEREEHRAEDVEFAIRPARQEDLAGIVGAIRQVAEAGTYIVAETVADEIDHQDALLRHNEIESRMFFVATVGEEVVGWVHIHGSELEKLSHTAELTVGVIDEYRGRGIGSHLLNRGLGWAASQGYERVYQSVPATNEEAIAFLEEQGWETEAVREDHYKINGHYTDEVMMAIRLP